MSRAQVKFEANESIRIGHTSYRVAEHPALPGIPYVQRGARGFVTQLIAPDGERMALKYFKLKYRVPSLVKVTEALKQVADLPGLRAARRTVFTTATHGDLLSRYPALEYGVLMPWLPGLTWYDIVTVKTGLATQESFHIAGAASSVLAGLEARTLAHCDIAGVNVMVERQTAQIELVDIEEMYGDGLPQPVEFPAGQDGYQHRTSRASGQWRAEGDRFGAAILIAEMLGWADLRIRQNSADEHYFSAAEMQDIDSSRYRLLVEVLRDTYAPAVAELFEQAWRSHTLADCPPISTWRDALAALALDARNPQPVTSPVISGRRRFESVPAAGVSDSPPPDPDRVQLDGIRLCRNCGAQNAAADNFCKRCGFYIGTGARRSAPVPATLSGQQVASSLSSIPSGKHSAVAPASNMQVPVQRDRDEIIAARRFGSSGGKPRRVTVAGKSPDQEGNIGSWLVLAVILGITIMIVALALVAK